MTRTIFNYLISLISLALLLPHGAYEGSPALAQIDNNQPARSVASVVDCIRQANDMGMSPEISPRLVVSCFGTAWSIAYYGQPGGDPLNGDAPGSDPAVVSFGDGKPDSAGVEPGKVTLANLQQVGAVYGLAYSSGSNPAAPAILNGRQARTTPREARIFAAAFSKRLTRFGPGGPGAIYAGSIANGATGVFVAVPGVVPGPATVLPHAGGALAYAPGDGSRATFPNNMAYQPEMGGIHRFQADAQLEQFATRTGLGDITLDTQERFLYAVNLYNRRVYRFDTWASDPQGTMTVLPDLVSALAPCATRGGSATYRPFGLLATRDHLYLGGACSDEFDGGSDRNDVALRIDRLSFASNSWELVTGVPLASYAAQRGTAPAGEGHELAWQPWRDTLPADSYLVPYPGAILADLAFDEESNLYLGVRDRLGDMGGARGMPVQASRGYGDLMIAAPYSGGWLLPTNGADPTNDDGTPGGAAGVHHNEALWGGMAYVPGRHDGGFGGEIAITGLTPYRTNSAGIYWYNSGRGNPTAREEIYHEGRNNTFAKVSGLGDLELLCAWSALGDRVWLDANANGVQDAGESGMNGVRVLLYAGADTTYSAPLASVTTGDLDGDGQGGEYRFYVEPFRSYRVRLDPAQFAAGGPLAGYFVAPVDRGGDDMRDSDADQISRGALAPVLHKEEVYTALDIGLAPIALASGQIGDRAWLDQNGDGLQSAGEPGQSGVRARIEACGAALPTASCSLWSVVAEMTTGSSGAYLFDRLPPNYYRVEFILPATHTGTRRDAGDDTRDSDADAASNWRTPATRVDSPGGSLHLDIGLLPAASNVSITKNGPASALLGATVEYTLNYAVAPGGSAATGVIVNDALPAGMTFLSATPAPTSVSGQTLRWDLGTLAAGSIGAIRISARADALGAQQNSATISTTAPGDAPNDNSATVSTLVQRPNLLIEKSGPVSGTPGAPVRYLINVGNLADARVPAGALAPAEGVIVEDLLPPGLIFDGATPAPTSVSGQTLRWHFGALAPGEQRTIEVLATIGATPPIAPTLTNRAVVSTTTPGDDDGDNESQTVTNVSFPDLVVTITDTPDPVGEAGALRYTITFRNDGTGAAESATLRVLLPTDVTFVGAGPQPPASVHNGEVNWSLGTLAPGAGGTLTIDTHVAPGAAPVLEASAEIATTTIGDNPANNRSTATTRVVAPPIPPPAESQLQLAIHSDLDPLSRDGDPRNAVYVARGERIAWPAGEVLDATLLARVEPAPLTGEAAALYEQRVEVTGWSLADVHAGGESYAAESADDMRRSGCRARDGASAPGLDGCVYRYVGGGSLAAPTPPTEDAMARQAHLFFATGLPLQMRPDVYVFQLDQLAAVHVRVQAQVRIETVNRATGEVARSTRQNFEQLVTIRLVAPRSAR